MFDPAVASELHVVGGAGVRTHDSLTIRLCGPNMRVLSDKYMIYYYHSM
jgi:hypothetical protein